LGWLGLSGAGAAVMAVGGGAKAHSPHNDEAKGAKKTYQGTSKKGDTDEALELATKAAFKDATATDAMVTWTLKEVSGRNGGKAGFNEVTVTIEARIS
jgi:hypothetical protein